MTTVTAGSQMSALTILIGGHTRMVTGPTPTSAGPGFRMRISAGPRIIMDDGCAWKARAGFGFRDMNGGQPGFPGEQVVIMSAGRRCLRRGSMFMKAAP